jgi:hypothetical protein
MALSNRMFLLDQADRLYRLPGTLFERMLREPGGYPIRQFSGARIRMIDMLIQLENRQPIDVAWMSFHVLTFNESGCLDPSAFERHQWARADLGLAPLTGTSDHRASVVDAATRFVARGGAWTPSPGMLQRLHDVALGKARCEQLSLRSGLLAPPSR